LHTVFYVLISGIAWRMLPKGFPAYRTVQRRLKVWLQRDLEMAACVILLRSGFVA
jgi:transposase